MDKKDENRELWNQMAGAGESIIGCAVLIALGVWAGGYLDKQFHTELWTIGLALLGAGLGLARMVMKAMKPEKK